MCGLDGARSQSSSGSSGIAGHDERSRAGMPFRGIGKRFRVSAARSRAATTARRASAKVSSAAMATSVLVDLGQKIGKSPAGRPAEGAGGFARQRPCHEWQDVDRAQAHLDGRSRAIRTP
ncbi:MAG: hypothetical protein PSV46_18160 [Reyranella sp.]|nr:hypothetical protein [Reyranella sp.]